MRLDLGYTPQCVHGYPYRKNECKDCLIADRDSLLENCEKMAETLKSVMSQLEWQIDYDADPENQSPEDMTAHVNGLTYKKAASALALYASRRNRL